MKRREFTQAAAVLPIAASLPLSTSDDWKSRMHRAFESHMRRSEILTRISRYTPEGLPSLFITSDVKIASRDEGGLGPTIPRFHVSCFVVFDIDRETETVDDIVGHIERRLECMEQALFRRAAEDGLSGNIAFASSPAVFHAADHGEDITFPFFRAAPGKDLVSPGMRAVSYGFSCQMVFR